jgi:hypothetical protein
MVGKAASAKNSTRHGILSQSPIVGDEVPEAWEAHLAGMRESWQPSGHFEEVLTHQAALNRWKRARLERWSTGIIQHQIELVGSPSRDDMELAIEGLPDDERFWLGVDVDEVLRTLDSLAQRDDHRPVAPGLARGVSLALQAISGIDVDGSSAGVVSVPADDHVPIAQLRQWIDQVAAHVGKSSSELLAEARGELGTAAILQRNRLERDSRAQALDRVAAYLPNERDAGREVRYGAQLDREFDRIIKYIERSQRARDGTLPAPLRVEVGEA